MSETDNYKKSYEVIKAWLACLDGNGKSGEQLLPSQMMGYDDVWNNTKHIQNCIDIKIISKNTTPDEVKEWASGIEDSIGREKLKTPAGLSLDEKLLIQINEVKKKYNNDNDLKEFIVLICDTMYLHYCFVNGTDEIVKKKATVICECLKVDLKYDVLSELKNYGMMNGDSRYNSDRWKGIYLYALLGKLYLENEKVQIFLQSNSFSENNFDYFKSELKNNQDEVYGLINKNGEVYKHLNILLSIIYPKEFITICVNSNKRAIADCFKELLKDSDRNKSIDKRLKIISDKLLENDKNAEKLPTGWIDFYVSDVKKLWKSTDDTNHNAIVINTENQASGNTWIIPISDTTIEIEEEIINENYKAEGALQSGKIVFYERNSKFIKERKESSKYRCQACDFHYNNRIVEGHHLKPLSLNKKSKVPQKEDVVILCPNCHRIAHYLLKQKPNLYVKEGKLLKELKEIFIEIRKKSKI